MSKTGKNKNIELGGKSYQIDIDHLKAYLDSLPSAVLKKEGVTAGSEVFRLKLGSAANTNRNRLSSVKLMKLEQRVEKLEESLDHNSKALETIKQAFISHIEEQSFDLKTQFIPVDIYLDSDVPEDIFEVYSKVIDFTESIGFEKNIELKAKEGSWIKKFLAKSKQKLSDTEVTNRLKEIEYALEVKILKDQSEVDRNQSAALADIMKSLENIPNAVMKVGSILVVKLTSPDGVASVQVRTLSIVELHLINKRPELLNKPEEIITALAGLLDDEANNDKLN